MNMNLLAEFAIVPSGICATLINRDALEGVLEGEGPCVRDALSAALQDSRVEFDTDWDEREACASAMRNAKASLALSSKGRLRFLGRI